MYTEGEVKSLTQSSLFSKVKSLDCHSLADYGLVCHSRFYSQWLMKYHTEKEKVRLFLTCKNKKTRQCAHCRTISLTQPRMRSFLPLLTFSCSVLDWDASGSNCYKLKPKSQNTQMYMTMGNFLCFLNYFFTTLFNAYFLHCWLRMVYVAK